MMLFVLGLFFWLAMNSAWAEELNFVSFSLARQWPQRGVSHPRQTAEQEWIWWWENKSIKKSTLSPNGRIDPQQFVGLLQEPETDWAYQDDILVLKRGALWLWMPEREFRVKLDNYVCHWPRGVKGRLFFQASLARMEIFVHSGEMRFPCFDFNQELRLTAGQGAFFNGDQGKLALEKLPSGRLIPIGEVGWLPKRELQAAIEKWNFAWTSLKKASLRQKKQEEERKKRQGLCHRPEAQFGQCMQRREQGVCKLYRCTAQGSWAYAYVVDDSLGTPCSLQGKVVECP